MDDGLATISYMRGSNKKKKEDPAHLPHSLPCIATFACNVIMLLRIMTTHPVVLARVLYRKKIMRVASDINHTGDQASCVGERGTGVIMESERMREIPAQCGIFQTVVQFWGLARESETAWKPRRPFRHRLLSRSAQRGRWR